MNDSTKASRKGIEDGGEAYGGNALSRTPEHGGEALPSVSYTMLSGGTVRVDQNNLSVNSTHRRNGSDSTAGTLITVNTRLGLGGYRLMGGGRTCLDTPSGFSGTPSKLHPWRTRCVVYLGGIGWTTGGSGL